MARFACCTGIPWRRTCFQITLVHSSKQNSGTCNVSLPGVSKPLKKARTLSLCSSLTYAWIRTLASITNWPFTHPDPRAAFPGSTWYPEEEPRYFHACEPKDQQSGDLISVYSCQALPASARQRPVKCVDEADAYPCHQLFLSQAHLLISSHYSGGISYSHGDEI